MGGQGGGTCAHVSKCARAFPVPKGERVTKTSRPGKKNKKSRRNKLRDDEGSNAGTCSPPDPLGVPGRESRCTDGQTDGLTDGWTDGEPLGVPAQRCALHHGKIKKPTLLLLTHAGTAHFLFFSVGFEGGVMVEGGGGAGGRERLWGFSYVARCPS